MSGLAPTAATTISSAAMSSFTWRIAKQRAITFKVLGNRRDAKLTTLGSSRGTQVTAGIFYTFLGQDHFGTIDWR